jgi:hypothetical protein
MARRLVQRPAVYYPNIARRFDEINRGFDRSTRTRDCGALWHLFLARPQIGMISLVQSVRNPLQMYTYLGVDFLLELPARR